MNIKKALLVTFSTGLIATSLVSTNYVSAEDGTPEDSDNEKHELPQSAQSDVEIKFSAPKKPVGPLNPDNLEESLEDAGNKGAVTGYQGPLSLNYVSNIEFEDEEINVEKDTYESKTKAPNIQVSDNRGYGYGWNVQAKAEAFKNEGKDSLPGAIIHFDNGLANSLSTSEKPEVNQEIKLVTAGSSDLIVNSDKRSEGKPQGLGEWIIKWISDENVTTEKIIM